MISKGCTVKNRFKFPFTKDEVEKLYITYQQSKKTVFEKELTDCQFHEDYISVDLTQEETLKLNSDMIISIQIRVKLKNGGITKSNVLRTVTDELLKDGVI